MRSHNEYSLTSLPASHCTGMYFRIQAAASDGLLTAHVCFGTVKLQYADESESSRIEGGAPSAAR